jgi:hypothetical protein
MGDGVAHEVDPAALPGCPQLVGANLLEQSDEWATQRARYMTLETITALGDTAPVSLPAMAD